MRTGEMHERRPQLLQKHYVLLAKVRSAKFLHNKSCGFFPPHFSPNFLPPSLPIADEGQREGGNNQNLRTRRSDLWCSGFFLL